MRRAVLLLLLLCLSAKPALADKVRGRQILERRLESLLFDGMLSDTEAETWLSRYDELLQSPLDANTVSLGELLSIPLMSEYLAYQFVKFRTEQGGRLRSLYDLKTLEGWGDEEMELFVPLLRLELSPPSSKSSLGETLSAGSSSLDLLLTYPKDETPNPEYIGTPEALEVRWMWQSLGRASAMLAAEKDSYEPWRRASHRGFDSYAGHIALKEFGVFKRIVLGDYRLAWGEGLTIRQGFWLSSLTAGQSLLPFGLRPVTTTSESDKSRGLATELHLGRKWLLTLAFSQRQLDGKVDAEDGLISGLSDAGLRRTETDWERRNTVVNRLYATQLAYESGRLRLALSAIRYDWGGKALRYALGSSRVAELAGLSSHSNLSLSYYYSNSRGSSVLSGELARSELGGFALVQRLALKTESLGNWQLALRRIDRLYWSYYGQSATHYRRPAGELGVGLGVNYPDLLPRLDLSSEIDLYRSMMERRSSGGDKGLKFRTTLAYRLMPHSKLELTTLLRSVVGEGQLWRMGLNYDFEGSRFKLSPSLMLSRYISESSPSGGSTLGYAFGLKLGYPLGERFRLQASGIYYRVEDWEARLYWSEVRLSQQFISTFLYGRGYRLAMTLDARMGRRSRLGLQVIRHERSDAPSSRYQFALQLSLR